MTVSPWLPALGRGSIRNPLPRRLGIRRLQVRLGVANPLVDGPVLDTTVADGISDVDATTVDTAGAPIDGCRGPTPAGSIEMLATRAARAASDDDVAALEVVGHGTPFASLFSSTRYQAVDPPCLSPTGGLAVDSGRFGVALCPGAVAQAPEPEDVLAELHRALGPTGRLFLSTPLVIDRAPSNPTAPLHAQNVRLGLNYLLMATGFDLEDLWPLADSASYAVVARKTAAPARGIATRGRLRPGSSAPEATSSEDL